MAKRTAFFFEDFARQIEILPIENLDFCRMQLGEIDDFSEQHQTGMGFNDIYIRKDHPHSFTEIGHNLVNLRAALNGILPEYDQAETEFGGRRILCQNTIAFGRDGGPTLFADFVDDGIISLLWCDGPLSELPDLPWAERHLYVDWESSFLCPLSEREKFLIHFEEQEKLRLAAEAKYGSQRKRRWWKFW